MFGKLKQRAYMWLTNYLPDEKMGDNAWNSAVDGMWYTVMTGLTQPFMNLFAMNLGATDQMLSYLSSWPSLVSLVAQVPAAMMTGNLPNIKNKLILWGFLHRINYLFFALLPFLPLAGVTKAWIYIVLVAAMNFPATVVNTMWTQIIGKLFPANLRGQVMADRSFFVGIVTLIFLLIAGPILDSVPYPYNFTLNFGLAFVALMMSLYYLSRLHEEPHVVAASQSVASPWSGMGAVLKDKPFLHFVFAAFIMNIGFGISSAMWTIYFKRQLFLSNTEIAFASIVSTSSSIIWYRFVPKLTQRLGMKNTFLVSYMLYLPVPLLYSFIQPGNPWLLWIISIVEGMAGATNNVSFINVILDSAADMTHRPSYLAFFNTSSAIANVIFPIVGMQIYLGLGGTDTRPVFMISTVIRSVAVLLMFLTLNAQRRAAKALENAES